jgi:hypothetical protein
MTTTELTVYDKPELEVAELRDQVQKIQGVMKGVMQEGVHYGVIPGTAKPTLLKPGAEKLCLTFRLDPQDEVIGSVETEEMVAFTVRTVLYHIPSGQRIASGVGSCNSREAKYRQKQPWDIHNTILKMASKRALVAAVLRGTAASDCFTQDIEEDGERAGAQRPIPGQPVAAADYAYLYKVAKDHGIANREHVKMLARQKLKKELKALTRAEVSDLADAIANELGRMEPIETEAVQVENDPDDL